MKRATTMLGALAVAFVGLLFAAPAAHAGFQGTQTETYNGVTCKSWDTWSHLYPFDDQHLWVCLSSPSTQRVNAIASSVQTLGHQGIVRDFLKTQDVHYYYFQNRSDYNSFMSGKFPFNQNFQTSAARCGFTGYDSNTGRINSAVFETCNYDTLSPPAQAQNPDIYKVVAHESGHAFDWAWRKSKGLFNHKGPSESEAFINLANYDLVRMEPPTWINMTTQQKVDYVCNVFQQYVPSQLEQSLGNVPNDKVCTSTHTINPTTGTKGYTTNGVIPKDVLDIITIRAPYFITNAGSPYYQELFAEEFARMAADGGPALKMTDQILKAQNGGLNYDNFACTRWAVRMFWYTLDPPPLTGSDSLGQHDSCINNPGAWQ